MDLTENAMKVLEKRYLRKDEKGNVTETPDEMVKRVASAVAKAEYEYGASDEEVKKIEDEFYEFIFNKYFMPNSPTLMNAGKDLGQLSACFVLPVEDSLEGIFETIKNTALIHQSGGGTGFSFSRLRPKGDIVKSTMGVSSGPISFMEVFNAATEAVKQGGTRRGANMGILRIDHPDIEEFITCKNDLTKLNNFNISIAITDKFMEALKNGKEFELIHPNTKECVKKVNANYLFNKIVKSAWSTGEPGIVFIDKINKYNPTPNVGEIESTNPCGEVPLLPYEACNLASINLSKMSIRNQAGGLDIDWEKLAKTTKIATRFLDDVITVNNYPLEKIAQTVESNRKIGLGVMGFADLLMELKIPYDSVEGQNLALRLMEFIDYHSKAESVNLSEKRGRFKNFEGSIYDNKKFLSNKYRGQEGGIILDAMWEELDRRIEKYGIRNATTTCIAPTGTISMIAGCSGGIEPLFGLVFTRDIMDGTKMLEVNPVFKKYMEEKGQYSEELMREVAQKGSIAHIDKIDEETKNIFKTAHDIAPIDHIKMQAKFQLHTDNAVSKTVNFVESATEDDIKQTYIMAYEYDLKGLTVYRNNSRLAQPMTLEAKKEEKPIELFEEKKEEVEETEEIKIKKIVCPECGSSVEMAEGCFICLNCGYTGCG